MKTKESQEESEVREAFRILDRQNKGKWSQTHNVFTLIVVNVFLGHKTVLRPA